MNNTVLKAKIANKWDEVAWNRAFDSLIEKVWDRVFEEHGACINYDIAGCSLEGDVAEDAAQKAMSDLVDTEINKDDSAELNAHMDEHLGPAYREVHAEYFRHYRAALDGAPADAECWKALSEYGVTADNLLEVHPEES